MAKTIVTTVANPSGIAATAKETAILKATSRNYIQNKNNNTNNYTH